MSSMASPGHLLQLADGRILCTHASRHYPGSIYVTVSSDEGETWAPPTRLVGPCWPGDGLIASWGYPMVSKSGRIYVVYNQHQGAIDVTDQFTVTMDCVYSDDAGKTSVFTGERY